jgi:hypothetical protein
LHHVSDSAPRKIRLEYGAEASAVGRYCLDVRGLPGFAFERVHRDELGVTIRRKRRRLEPT